MKGRHHKRKVLAEINVVPYIDVMLVLLIIFMITAPLITQGVDVDLPQATAEPLSQDAAPPLIVSIDRQGLYYLQGSGVVSEIQALAPEDMLSLVAAERENDASRSVVVRGDTHVEYGQVVQLLVLLQQAGVPDVGLMTEQP